MNYLNSCKNIDKDFSDKQYCKNLQSCNFLLMTQNANILKLRGCTTEFKDRKNITQFFLGQPVKFSLNLKLFMHKCPKICLLTEIVKLSKYGKVHMVKIIDILLDQQIARYFVNIFQTPLPFYATQIINPFLNTRISANQDKKM